MDVLKVLKVQLLILIIWFTAIEVALIVASQ